MTIIPKKVILDEIERQKNNLAKKSFAERVSKIPTLDALTAFINDYTDTPSQETQGYDPIKEFQEATKLIQNTNSQIQEIQHVLATTNDNSGIKIVHAAVANFRLAHTKYAGIQAFYTMPENMRARIEESGNATA